MKFMQPEPLTLSAPLALRLAPGMCSSTAGKDDSCAWSHGFWQYLRLLGMAGDPTNHDAFFVDALVRSLHEKKDPHVLVCGSADYAMLAMLLRAFERLRHRGEVTVVDRCETPLWLNRWYADSMSFPIVTERCDILDMGSDRTFDLICTHSFFSYFEPAQRPGLLRQWHRLLRPGGAVVTASRIRDSDPTRPDRFSERQADEFVERVRRRASALPALPGITAAELDDHARAYARKVEAWPVRSLQEIRSLFEAARFQIDQLASVTISAGDREARANAGPTAPVAAEYAHVVATRP